MKRLLLIFVLAFAALVAQGALAVADVSSPVAVPQLSATDAPKSLIANLSAPEDGAFHSDRLEPWDTSPDDDDPSALSFPVPVKSMARQQPPLLAPLPGTALLPFLAWRPPAR